MFFDGDDPIIEFDNLCGCGDPECLIGRAAAIAKKLHNGETVTADEGRELAEGFAGVVMTGKAISFQLRLAEAALQLLAFGDSARPQDAPQAPPRPKHQPRQQHRNPFSGN